MQTVGGSERTARGCQDPPTLRSERHPPARGASSHHLWQHLSKVDHVAKGRKRNSGKDRQPWCLSQVCAGFHPGQSLQPRPGARSSEARVSARPPCGSSRRCCCQSARISSQRRVMLRYPTFTLDWHWQCDLDRVWDLGTSASVALSAAITLMGSHPWHRAGAYTLLVGDRRLLMGHELGPSRPR